MKYAQAIAAFETLEERHNYGHALATFLAAGNGYKLPIWDPVAKQFMVFRQFRLNR